LQSFNQTGEEKTMLEKQIQQLFLELVSVWRDTDIKKADAVRRLAARIEELYLSQGRPEMVNTISRTITQKLRNLGIATAEHVSDYLDEQYKQAELARDGPDKGADVNNNELEQSAKANPFDLSAEEKRTVLKKLKKRQTADDALVKSLESAAQIQKQALDYETDTFSHSTTKSYESSRTDIPNNHYRGAVHQAMSELVIDLGKYYYDLKETLDDVERWYDPKLLPEARFVKMIEQLRGYILDVRKVIAPAKDLKFATSMHNWFHTLLKFLSHGKHAAAVMTSIPSAKHFKIKPDGTKEYDKRPLTREQVGDNIPEIEDLLERYADSKEFLSEIVSFFRRTGEWDRDDTIREYRREHCEKLVRHYADNGDFYHMLSNFRETTMDSEVAARRINARPTLSGLA
jgi:hypothetical protein